MTETNQQNRLYYKHNEGDIMSRFKYTLHNIVGHPMMEIFNLLGFHDLATWIHDTTFPTDSETQNEDR